MRLAQLVAVAALSLTRVREDSRQAAAAVLTRRQEPVSDTGNGEELGGALTEALNFSNPEVPQVPVGSDMEAVAQELDTQQAADLAAPPAEGGLPTFAPLDGRPEEAKTAEDYQADLSDAIAGEKDDVARSGLTSCGCECCMGVRRAEPTPTSNWTCYPVPNYLVSQPDQVTDNVVPPTDFGAPTAPASCAAVEHSECGSRAHGADKDEPLEALSYGLFCATHCRPVDGTTTPCIAFDDATQNAAWKDGTWTDPLAPSTAEVQQMDAASLAKAQASALSPVVPGASASAIAAVHAAEASIDGLTEPVAAAEKGLEHATTAFG